MFGPNHRFTQLDHALYRSQGQLKPALQRHLAKSFDLLGMEAAFDEHIGILVALFLGRELDSEFAQLLFVDVAGRLRH